MLKKLSEDTKAILKRVAFFHVTRSLIPAAAQQNYHDDSKEHVSKRVRLHYSGDNAIK